MRKIFIVAVREYESAVRTKAFIITLVAMPLLMGGSIAMQALLGDKVDTSDRKLALIDQTGRLFDAVAADANARNESAIFVTKNGIREQNQPRFIIEKGEWDPGNSDRILFGLSEQIRKNELFAFAILPKDIIEPGKEKQGGPIQYYSNSPTYFDLSQWLSRTVNSKIQQLRFEAAGLDPDVVAKATYPIDTEELGLMTLDAAGQVQDAEKTSRGASFAVPAALMMLLFMVVMVGASPLVQSVLEEKIQRIAEVLLGSIPPFHLMMGKLLGTVAVSLTISVVYLAGAYAVLQYLGYANYFPTHLVWWFLLYQALAVLMFGSVFIAVGAAVSDIKESQSMLMPVMILIVSPLFVWTSVLQAPTTTFSVVVSLIPPATPMLMLLRQAIPPGVPLWQPILGIVGVVLTTILMVFAAGRIFRVGILMQGKGAKFSDLFRWALRG
ncbi:MAG: ABC transporter permease [Pirellulales bacterium]|nr:ABC transporter permease [Pirellulales bacterium]